MKRQGQTGRCIDSGGYLVSFLQRANAEAAIMTLHQSWTCLSAQSFRPAIALLLKTGVVIWCSVPLKLQRATSSGLHRIAAEGGKYATKPPIGRPGFPFHRDRLGNLERSVNIWRRTEPDFSSRCQTRRRTRRVATGLFGPDFTSLHQLSHRDKLSTAGR